MLPKVSIIIAVGKPGDFVIECITHCLQLDYPDYEIIVRPDEEWIPPDESIRVIPTGAVKPAEKRDRGIEKSTGEIMAVIDDDAYPAYSDWLSGAVCLSAGLGVAAVGALGVTPPADNPSGRIPGWIYESRFVSVG